MASWKKGNFDEMEGRTFGAVQGVFARKELGSRELGVSRFTYPPNERFPFAHRHGEQEETYVVASGSGRMKLGDEIVELRRWDVLRVDPEVGRQIESGPDGLEIICVGGSRPEGGDGEPVEDFWD